MYPCRGVLHTPHKCPHRGQINSPIWIDRLMCLFVLTPSIHELFTPSNYRSSSEPFVGRMQYAPTMIQKCYAMIRFPDPFRDCLCGVCNTPLHRYENTMRWFVLSDPYRNRLWGVCNTPLPWYENAMRWFVLSDPSRDRLWGVRNTPLPFRMKKEGLKMFLRYFLRLKIESKYSWGTFWGSK